MRIKKKKKAIFLLICADNFNVRELSIKFVIIEFIAYMCIYFFLAFENEKNVYYHFYLIIHV